jgi:hypothetical protein
MKYAIAVLSCLLIVPSVPAQVSRPEGPKGPAPILRVVASADATKGLISVKELRFETGETTKVVEEVSNGKKLLRLVTEKVTVPVEVVVNIETANCRIITADGKNLPLDDFWKLVRADIIVAISDNGTAPAAAFLHALNPATVVIILPVTKN